jgi:hypothetical protein
MTDTPAGPAPGPVPADDPAPGYAEAWEAVTDLLERVYDGTWCQRDSDVMHATLEAAWPVLAAHAAATERERIHRQLAGYRFHDECKRGDDCPNVYHVRLVLPAAGDAIVTRYRPGGADLLDGDTR